MCFTAGVTTGSVLEQMMSKDGGVGGGDTVDNRKGRGPRGYFRLNQGFQLMFNALLERQRTGCTSQHSQNDTRH